MDILSNIGAFIGSIGIAISSFFAPAPEPTLSAALPSATAIFETSLAAPISSSATSMTLSSNSVRGGGALSGYNCFTLDEGSSQAEFACGTVSGTAVSSLTRGISPLTGTTTDSDLQFAHRRGASVKITDFPLIQILKAQANGEDTYPNILKYASHPTFTATTDIVDKKYVDDIAISGAGVIDATTAARGVVEFATAAEQAASTAAGSSGTLALKSEFATSTYNSATAGNVVVVTGSGGTIDKLFIPTTLASTTFSGFVSLSGVATSTIASTSLAAFTSSTTPTTTWTKPSNLKYVIVEVIAGGGGGGGNTAANGECTGGAGGGYAREIIPAAALGATETVTVGGGGTGEVGSGSCAGGNTGGPSSFGAHLSATGGSGDGRTAGTGSGGDINLSGHAGARHMTTDNVGGQGGGTFYAPATNWTPIDNTAANGASPGGGGAGSSTSGADAAGGNGAVGAVYVWQYFY